ncbi:hypothetical protein MDA_GLEAN10024355 [Myotis davidii]|uniref:Uncharacterized protein n=1 Tax=Myotis davidii TaxID=225400 RepID=L5LPJ4_MYODS|nr:hypothetical protein MDA_GLEAN10024355 [Myotis davidii]
MRPAGLPLSLTSLRWRPERDTLTEDSHKDSTLITQLLETSSPSGRGTSRMKKQQKATEEPAG